MAQHETIHVLIAEDNDVSRQLMVGILKKQGYQIHEAINGEEAIGVIGKQRMDLALVDINMSPLGGFEFIRHLRVQGMDIPVIIVTGDDRSDMLFETRELGVDQVITKPVQPDRLLKSVARVLQRKKLKPPQPKSQIRQSSFTPEELMKKALDMAQQNFSSGKGGPFGAVVADRNGRILGEGVNGMSSRVDPTAHAEVMAIREAAERLERSELSDCTLYCSSEPTMMGKALITSVGIRKVYYGLSHAEVWQVRTQGGAPAPQDQPAIDYEQFNYETALAMFKGCYS